MCLIGFTVSLSAAEYPNNYRGIRPLGMGGAFTAISDDENALFYNPAGLSNISTFSMGIVNPMVDVSENSIDFYRDLTDADLDDTGETTELLRKHVGEYQHLAINWIPYVGFNAANVGVMVAGIASASVDAEIRNPPYPEFHPKANWDYGFTGGAGLKVPLQGLRVGGTVKYIDRESLDEVYTAADIADDDFEDRLDDDRKSGSGVTMDLGVLYELPIESSFTTDVGLSVNNLIEMDMDDAEDIKRTINLGIATRRSFGGFKLIGAFDILDITKSYEQDDDFMKRIHMGAELQMPVIAAIRMGFNQGYLTAGATLDFPVVRLDFATYAEEVGAYSGQREDRRYVGQLSIGW
ncbi:MAG: hypothetical protein C4522_21650 [Desulfobacteraceae bacterium]|nr:MAG: hypothetical protein C4522_21650 [Desulfobacteraceae bacterium]